MVTRAEGLGEVRRSTVPTVPVAVLPRAATPAGVAPPPDWILFRRAECRYIRSAGSR